MNDKTKTNDAVEQADTIAAPVERLVMCVFDKNGIPLHPKDVLKVFHFTGQRRKKHYMYKQVDRQENGYLIVKHLNTDGEYKLKIDNRRLDCCEIVQGYAGVPSGGSFEDRARMST